MKPKGFSIIELLISIAIFITLTGVMLANFRQGNYSDELQGSADLLATHLREAQNKALSGLAAASLNGYGVYFVNGDMNFINYNDAGATVRQYDSGEENSTVKLRKNTSFVSAGVQDIFFASPGGSVYLNGAPQSGTVAITLRHSISLKSIDITILPFSGQISISNTY